MSGAIYFGNPTTFEISFAPAAIGVPVNAIGAQYLLLAPHILNGVYRDRGETVREIDGTGTGDVPPNWIPTLAVDPLNTRAATAYYNAGPRTIAYEDLNQWANSLSPAVIKPVTFWIKVGNQYKLTGLGVNFAPVYQ